MPLDAGRRLDREWLLGRLPHEGRMCLLDEVLRWDARRIFCRAAGHRAADHPLRAHGRLGVACGIEYAAQAMAVHGVLIGGTDAGATGHGGAGHGGAGHGRTGHGRTGLLASVRSVRFRVPRLDHVRGDLICEAARIAADGGTAIYEFAVRGDAALLLTGRAGVVFGRAVPQEPG